MKKLLAALLAILVTAALAGCGKPAEEQLIDDITEDTSLVTETSETVSETETETSDETTEAASETAEIITEETSAETTTGIVSDTKMSEETTLEIVSETEETFEETAAEFPVGIWTENRAYVYDFGEDGSLSINTGYYVVNGSYTYENGALAVDLLDPEGDTYKYIFDISGGGDQYIMTDRRIENEYGFWDPYEPTGIITGYFPVLGSDEKFSLQRGDLVENATFGDVNGIWRNADGSDEVFIFDNEKCFYGRVTSPYVGNCSVKNETLEAAFGKTKFYFMLYDGRLFMTFDGVSKAYIFERAEPSRLSQSDFDGRCYFETGDGDYALRGVIKNGKGVIVNEITEYETNAEITVTENNGQTLYTVTVDGKSAVYTGCFALEKSGSKSVYLFNDNDMICILAAGKK